ncbi:putative nucleic acid-binding protein, contains PIN domain [Nostoc sp. PCC 7524]|uniref:type II toxin-antitoxin system VapC family toxin n=1 Tax=Nostoc sp. (strain ATCC 29411 / PCC 7524) TaxID=28072 RepID=UPI00029ECBE3|nr:type II toxin-antitoxin system VapC family toxin [Nostoc sp. PCC 7524]AFY47646.1 putative nucleic acid-binding protein, contains PIN domain [Nostoc sp. PCC 7524]
MSRQIICVDSNFVVKLIKNSSQNSTHLTLWDNWEQNQTQIIAPTLLCYEVTNVFHRMQLAKQLLKTEAEECINLAFNLSIQFYSDRQLHQQAWEFTQQFNLPATYDAHYLALAQRFQADFYTGDKRLFNSVSSVLSWIHLVE